MRHVASAGYVSTSFRTLPRFRLVRARSVDEAVTALGEAETPAVLAGGTDLPARFNEGFAPSDVVDLSRLDMLRQIDVREGALHIGAAVTHSAGSTHPDVMRLIPGFAQAWARIANIRIRLSATLGGNIMARRTRYEGAIILAALDARLRFVSTAGDREMLVKDFIQGAAIPRHALLTAIIIPLRPGWRLDYDRSLRPIVTQAVSTNTAGYVTVVTATEHVMLRIETGTQLTHHRFADPVTSDAYLNRVRATLLTRQLQRLGAA